MNALHQVRIVRVAAAVFLWLIPSVLLFAQAPPSADTFVSSATPKTNYGPGITLVVGSGSTSYLQFNLSGMPAGVANTRPEPLASSATWNVSSNGRPS
jgi:hypothetical protein